MSIKEIVTDSLRYPFSDWKKILIFGVIFVISSINTISGGIGLLSTNEIVICILGIISFVFVILAKGYGLKIINSSLMAFQTYLDLILGLKC